MSEINVSQMGRDALEATAADLGIEYRSNISDEKLAERIRVHLGEPAPAVTKGEDLAPNTAEKRYRIVIATDSQDKQPIRVGVNGHSYTIKRGEEVTVPAPVVEALNHAVQYVYDPQTMARQEVLSYPFQILGEVA
jgi:hypothetical protein